MGKPMGNGHPLAAVVTRPDIAEALANDTGYFNTFGGNPVSCAAGLAVLDVIEQEGLQQNALEVGEYLQRGFKKLKADYPVLGQIHGAGLLLGVDIVNTDGKPDPALAKQIVNQLRDQGILIGITGQYSQVLKIRPPLVFEKKHADMLLDGLKIILEDL
jgi:4-aminobutyrate aminotransferase-like enzyme